MESSNIGFTQIDIQRAQFTWKINTFSSLSYCIKDPATRLESPIFTVKPNDDMKWQLLLWPNGRDEYCSGFLSASLYNPSANSSKVQVLFALSILDNGGRKCYERSKEFNPSINHYDGFNEFVQKNILLSKANDFIRNDVLTMFCELKLMCKDGIKNIDQSIQQIQPLCIERKALNAFEEQLEKQEFSDVKLVASCGKELLAHKFMLAARSPVFSAMFSNDMKEKNDQKVVIQDLDYNSLKEMLRFMYAGRVENLDKSINGVLAAQEKYQIDGLKEYCEDYLFYNINIENAVESLALSIRYNIDKIKFLSTRFIRCHGKDVSVTAAFKAIDEPHLLAEIVHILANL